MALIASAGLFAQTELVRNGSCDLHIGDTNDNADSWDMTPNSKLDDDNGNEITSPYRFNEDNNPNGWYNSDLADWLETNCGDSDEQPGSSSDGNWDYTAGPTAGVKTRGVKINEACRRLYQKVVVTPGKTYTFSIESRSEAENVPSEVFMLNTEISDELNLSATSTTVDHYFEITNDYNPSKSNETTNNFTTTSFSFTASGSFVVIYVRASAAVDSSNEVFYDNISLIEQTTASVDDIFSSKVSVYPNPAKESVTITSQVELNKIEVFNLLGKQVIKTSTLNNNILDVSSLSKGVYLMKLTSGDSVATRKLIKN